MHDHADHVCAYECKTIPVMIAVLLSWCTCCINVVSCIDATRMYVHVSVCVCVQIDVYILVPSLICSRSVISVRQIFAEWLTSLMHHSMTWVFNQDCIAYKKRNRPRDSGIMASLQYLRRLKQTDTHPHTHTLTHPHTHTRNGPMADSLRNTGVQRCSTRILVFLWLRSWSCKLRWIWRNLSHDLRSLRSLRNLSKLPNLCIDGLEALFAEDHVALLEADLIIFSSLTPTIMTMGLSNVMQMSTRKLQQAASWAESLGNLSLRVLSPRRLWNALVELNTAKLGQIVSGMHTSWRPVQSPATESHTFHRFHRSFRANATELQQLPTDPLSYSSYLHQDCTGTGSGQDRFDLWLQVWCPREPSKTYHPPLLTQAQETRTWKRIRVVAGGQNPHLYHVYITIIY